MYFPWKQLLLADSLGMLNTIKTMHERKDYLLCRTVHKIWNAFDGEEIDVLDWIRWKASLVDEMTKNNQ